MLRNPRIETPRTLLRPYTMEDLEALYAVVSQEEVRRHLPPTDPMSMEETRRTLRWILECYGRNTPDRIVKLSLAVTLRETGEYAGWCGLGPLDCLPPEIEIYYGLSGRHWNKGLMTEAAGAMLRFAFEATRLDRIVGTCHPDNIASRRVLEKIGLRFQGPLKDMPEEHRFFEGFPLFALGREEHLENLRPRGPHRLD